MNLEVYIWIICFLSLYVAIFWINVISLGIEPNPKPLKKYPTVSIAIAAYNEEKGIIATIKSLLALDYPKDKLEILVINDGSKDKTKEVVEEFLKENKYKNIKLIDQIPNQGKGAALNLALKNTKGEFFGVFDADSVADPISLKVMLPYFDSDKIAAVISPIKVLEYKNTIEKIQRLEYIFATFIRKLMSTVGTLHNTPGVLSIYRTNVLRNIGGFDTKTLTEDYEVAMRLKNNHYIIKMCAECQNYTIVPQDFKSLWRQRVRWFRGFITTQMKYRQMFMNKKYGLMGIFQTPLDILTFFIVLSSVIFLTYQFIQRAINLFYRLVILKWSLIDLIELPKSFMDLILNINIKLLFPVAVTFVVGIYLYFKAHNYINETWKFHFASFIYLFIYPVFRSFQWVHAFVLEMFGAKRKW